MTPLPLWSASRPFRAGAPCWLANPLVVVPSLRLVIDPEGVLRVGVQVPSEESWAFREIFAEVAPEALPGLLADWWQSPEGALEKWWGGAEVLSWGSASATPPIVAQANPEELGL